MRSTLQFALCAILIGSSTLLIGCRGEAEPSEPEVAATEAPPTEAAPPTAISRMEATSTPTVDPASEPMAPVGSEELPGIVVPAAAELVEFVEPTENTDARADYRIADVEAEALYEWFETEMQALGWGEPEDRDGSLIFLHETELGARFAKLGQKRTATVIFDLTDEIDFSILAESPE